MHCLMKEYAMIKKRIKNYNQGVDCTRMVNNVVNTVDGLESVHINLATGEITYGPTACIDETMLSEAFSKEGYELEDVKK
jgi:copper chaperone CopZ